MPAKRLTYSAARRILNAYCVAADGRPASTNKVPSKKRNEEGRTEAWWLAHMETCPPPDSPRTKAYLKAYTEIAGDTFYATGIPLDGGLMMPDMAVMKCLLQAGAVRLSKVGTPKFELTEVGLELIAGVANIPEASR